ncbi:MAG: hypothetical protein WKF36_05040 [Candidatus Nitrosocosmicus sp.]
MSSNKDDFTFNKVNLLKTPSGRKILKKGLLKMKAIDNSKNMLICQEKSMMGLSSF